MLGVPLLTLTKISRKSLETNMRGRFWTCFSKGTMVLTANEQGLAQLLEAVTIISKSCGACGASKYALPAELRQSKDTSRRLVDGEVQDPKIEDKLANPRVVWLMEQTDFPLQRIPTTSAMSAMQSDEG